MALAISLNPHSEFYVGDTKVTVHEVHSLSKFKVKVHGASIDTIYEINDQRATEIMPNVRVSAGIGGDPETRRVKVVIDAPRHIKILRKKLYKGAQKGGNKAQV